MATIRLSICVFTLVISLSFVAALPDDYKLPVNTHAIWLGFSRSYSHISHGRVSVWEMMQIGAICSIVPAFWFLQKRRQESKPASWSSTDQSGDGANAGLTPQASVEINETEAVDPGLLKKHSELRTYKTSKYTYKALRVFYQKHPQADKLPTKPAPLPLLVFIHGLGGSIAQFNPLLTSLVNLSSCLAVDLPGCGLSSFSEHSWDGYKVEALAELLAIIIEDYRDREGGQGVVLIGHSLGCSLATLLASTTSPLRCSIHEHVLGFVGICPRADPPSAEEAALFKRLSWLPDFIIDLMRSWDRRGGTESHSVSRFVASNADEETKKLQLRFNIQSKTPVWRRMVAGTFPTYKKGATKSIAKGGIPGPEVWAGLEIPVFLVGGEADKMTKPEEITKIASALGKSSPSELSVDDETKQTKFVSGSAAKTSQEQQVPIETESHNSEEFYLVNSEALKDAHQEPSTLAGESTTLLPQPRKPKKVLKTTILPAPASHALLYMPSTVRTLAGLISDFLSGQVTPRLSLGWQLQFLSTSGKWDVKNLAKWQAVKPVSEPVAGVFRALKTLREVDESHSPEIFVHDWGHEIKDIVDISHETPVYDPHGLEKGGIMYHKFPTVSKIPPTGGEITAFVTFVDQLRAQQEGRSEAENWKKDGPWYIGVHCHYGFNRTGYFVVCYLVERCGYTVQGAIDEFAKQRPPGIRHAHFLDQLFVRYCVGLQRTPTL